MKTSLVVLVFTLTSGVARYQQDHHHPAAPKDGGAQTSTLTAEQVAQLLAGEGMGLAKAAELNHFPGPKHVLELAKELEVTTHQLQQIETIRSNMLVAAKKLGAELVEAERTLDLSFKHAHIDPDRLRALTGTIGRLQGELRAAHLHAHLLTRDVLSPEQVARYDVLRGHTK